MSKLAELSKLLKEAEVPHHHYVEDNNMMVARKFSTNSGIEGSGEEAILLYNLLAEGEAGWGLIIQVQARVTNGEGLFTEENSKKILEVACQQYKERYPYLDAENQHPIEWDVSYSETFIHRNGETYGVIEGAMGVPNISPEEMFKTLEQLGDIPEFEVVVEE